MAEFKENEGETREDSLLYSCTAIQQRYLPDVIQFILPAVGVVHSVLWWDAPRGVVCLRSRLS